MREFKVLFIRLIFLLVFYSIARLFFLILNPVFNEYGLFSVINAFWVGIWYDTSTIVYSNILLILISFFQFFKPTKLLSLLAKWYYIIINTVFVFFNLIDAAYFKFSGKRSGIDLMSEVGEWLPLLKSYLIDYYYILFLLIPVPLLLKLIWDKTEKINSETKQIQLWYKMLISLGLMVLFFLGARGGWGLTPLTSFDASKFAGPNFIPLSVNTGFNMIMTVQQQGVLERKYFSENEVSNYYTPIHNIESKLSKPKNLVLIVVESLGKEYVGLFNKGKSKTPFIDSLMNLSSVYNHAYSNGKRSIEGLPSIIASMPSFMNTDYPSSYYQANLLNGIGFYLQQQKYDASFYHGGRNGTMSFDNIVASTSNGKYFGMNEYPDLADFDGSWGIYDDKYLLYWANELSNKKQPFFSGIFTLSSHHPYPIPDRLKNKFPKGSLPIHESISYVDYSLQLFFDKIKNKPWYQNSVFVFVADHAAENEKQYYQTNQGKFEIPLFVFDPENPNYKLIDRTVSQSDLMPIALESISFSGKVFGFGTYPEDSFAVQFHDGYYQMVQYPYVLHFDGNNILAFYNLSNDSLMKLNLFNDKSTSEIQIQMENKLKAYLQEYSNRLIRNKTHLD